MRSACKCGSGLDRRSVLILLTSPLFSFGLASSAMADRPSLDDFATPGARAMVKAVSDGRIDRALQLASSVPGGVNHAGNDGATALEVAVMRNNPAMVQALLRAGAHPNGAPDRAPIHEAMKSTTLETARLLLAAGADPNGRSGGEPAMFESALLGDVHGLDLLLQAGAHIDLADEIGDTAAMIAATSDHWPAVIFLLRAGAKPWMAATNGATLGTYAAYSRLTAASLQGRAKNEVITFLRHVPGLWPPPPMAEVKSRMAARRWPPAK